MKAKRECSGRPMRNVCPPPYMEFAVQVVPAEMSQFTQSLGLATVVLTHCIGSKIFPSSQMLVKSPALFVDNWFATTLFEELVPTDGVWASG